LDNLLCPISDIVTTIDKDSQAATVLPGWPWIAAEQTEWRAEPAVVMPRR
jgi:hypothetical protein